MLCGFSLLLFYLGPLTAHHGNEQDIGLLNEWNKNQIIFTFFIKQNEEALAFASFEVRCTICVVIGRTVSLSLAPSTWLLRPQQIAIMSSCLITYKSMTNRNVSKLWCAWLSLHVPLMNKEHMSRCKGEEVGGGTG